MSAEKIIPLCVPNIIGNEWKYVKDCLDTGWISSVGSYVSKFEEMVAEYVGAKYGIATMNGTAALHISLIIAGVEHGDYVIIPNITFVATANAVMHAGAEPILIDAYADTWQMNLELLETFLEEETCIKEGERVLTKDSRRVKAIMPVHIQGNIGDMNKFMEITERFQLFVIEDSTEALGSTFEGRHSGTFGQIGTFSFNGNKIVSTGGGGVVVTDNEQISRRIKHITTTAKTDPIKYYHDEVGYNYRLVNVLAAMGVAQMENIDFFVNKKQEIDYYYRKHLEGVGDISFQKILPNVNHNGWLFTIKSDQQAKILEHLANKKITSRPFWMPMNKLPMYKDCHYINDDDTCGRIHETCLALPCSTNITLEELERVVFEIKSVFQ